MHSTGALVYNVVGVEGAERNPGSHTQICDKDMCY